MSKEEDLPIEVVREGVRLYKEGKLHEVNSNNREAIACYQKMMDLTFPDPPVLNRITYCHLRLNEVETARNILRQALSLDPYDEELCIISHSYSSTTARYENERGCEKPPMNIENRSRKATWRNK